MQLHRGISFHKMPIGGDPGGLIFVIGILAIALIGLVEARMFLALSLSLGVLIGIILRLTSRD